MNPISPPVIVVGIDGSDSATIALQWAAAEAKVRGARLELVLAYLVPLGYAGPGAMIPPELFDGALAAAEDELAAARAVALAVAPEVPIHLRAVQQAPLFALVEASKGAELLVVGSHGMGVVGETLLGSIAQRAATHAHSPVVVVRTDPHDRRAAAPPAKDAPVMVGIDGSDESDQALAFALDEAAARGVSLLAVRTWDEEPLGGFLRAYPLAVDHARIDAQEAHLLAEQVGRWQPKYPGVPITEIVRRGQPAGALLRAEGELRPALLVVGSRGRGGFVGMVLGSTSHELIAYAAGPVAVVRTGGGSAQREDLST